MVHNLKYNIAKKHVYIKFPTFLLVIKIMEIAGSRDGGTWYLEYAMDRVP